MLTIHPAEQSGIQDVIREQLDAIARMDGERALAQMTPRRRRGSGSDFLTTISHAFPALARAWKAQFGAPGRYGKLLAQPVRVTAYDHSTLDAVFLVAQQSDGTWLIDGCVCGSEPKPPPMLN